ncbi:MAG: permease [Bacillota bacterium]|nr:permease [Bacillota bacterium]
MEKLKKFIKRYKFFLILVLINIVVLIIEPEKGKEIASLSFDNFLGMLSVIPPIFLLLGLMDVWVPKETIMKYMGKGSGIKGAAFAFVLGSFTSGPLYASFPVAALFLRKGVSLTNVFIFVGAWSATKIPMLLFEITQLGGKFTLLRFVLNLFVIFISAWLLEKTTSQEEEKMIQDLAHKENQDQ